ncbi:MAG: response regulator [Treponema sp.]|jgi:adenylate cyclase|nr:response regulator [Treponema sp.]
MSNGEKMDGAKRILLLEDSDIFAEMAVEFLSGEGYQVNRAENGFEGLKLVYSFLPHLIVTDVEMPFFKGYQVARLLKSRKNTRNIPIVMFTSLGESRDRFWGLNAGADRYVEKSPDNFSGLREVIASLLAEAPPVDFALIEREGRRINDQSLIEMVNNLLDNKLFQTTVISMLAELSGKLSSLDDIAAGIFALLHNVCETEIVSIMITGTDGALRIFTANYASYNGAAAEEFSRLRDADFIGLFPDFRGENRLVKELSPLGAPSGDPPASSPANKHIESYIMIPLVSSGRRFASVHIANSIKEYFSPAILENLQIFLAAAAPVISNALAIREMEELQRKTRTAFARYVPEDVMDEIIRKPSDVQLQNEIRNVAVLFSDIREFTKISENSGAQQVVSFLNQYFSVMGNEILDEGGHIDKFIGDAIMAVFGVHRSFPNTPAQAIRTGVRMLSALEKVDASGIKLPPGGLKIGVGINCGECVVGNIGFHDRMDYTLIGNTVNVASRLEGTTKMYRHPLIVSEFMHERAKDHFIFRRADIARVKGKDEPVGIYAVYAGFEGEGDITFRNGEKSSLPVVKDLLIDRELLNNYNKGLHLFYMREWGTARDYFNKARELNKDDYLSSLYLERCAEYLANPPPPDWDGAVTLTEK